MVLTVEIQRLLFPRPHPQGMNPWVLMSLACAMRQTHDPVGPPVTVAREGDLLRIVDGRHRVVAAIMAGREFISAVIGD